MTRVVIDTDVELYPQVTLDIGDEEIAAPGTVPVGQQATAGIEVPADVAARWKAARDTWRAVQAEAAAYAGCPDGTVLVRVTPDQAAAALPVLTGRYSSQHTETTEAACLAIAGQLGWRRSGADPPV